MKQAPVIECQGRLYTMVVECLTVEWNSIQCLILMVQSVQVSTLKHSHSVNSILKRKYLLI